MARMSWLAIVGFIVAGFFFLGKGAEWLVGGSTVLARRMGVSAMVVGLTVVAWGTSLPEVVVSVGAAMDSSAALSLGNVLGSNIANIGLVLGACALVLPTVLEGRLAGREIFWFLLAIFLLLVLCYDSVLSRWEGVALLGVFIGHTWDVFRQAKLQARLTGSPDKLDPGDLDESIGALAAEAEALENIGELAVHWYKHPVLEALLGMVSIAIGAYLVVDGAKGGALRLGVDERVVGLTVVALGTSLPELAAGLGGAFKGEKDISMGNVVGSNIFNVLAVMGLTAIAHPLDAAWELANGDPEVREKAANEVSKAFEGALSSDFPLAIGFSLFVVALPLLGGPRFGRLKGALLLSIYIGYSIWLYYQA